MVGIIPAQNISLSLLRKEEGNISQSRNKKETSTQNSPLTTALEKANPEKADELKKNLKESQAILKQLESSRQDINEQRRTAAAEKIQQIKEKLKALRLLMPVDPEAAARQVKQLARELAQAVREYVRAGGGGAGASLEVGVTGTIVLAGAGVNTASAASAVNPEVAAGAEGQTVSTEAAGISDAVASALPQTEAGARPENTKNANETGSDEQVKASPETAHLSSEEIRKQKEEEREYYREEIQSQIALVNQITNSDRANVEFINEVNKIKDGLEAVIRLVKKKIGNESNSVVDRDIENTEDSLRRVQKYLDEMRSTGATATIGIVNVLT